MSDRGVRAHLWAIAGFCLAAANLGIGSSGAAADTLEWALVQAYQNNPSLNAQRASLRATDENVPQALSGYRPKLSVTASGGYNFQNATSIFPLAGFLTTTQFAQTFYSRTVGATGTYTLYNGMQTANRTRQAESQVDAARETLRVTEQQVLLDAATAYMNLLRVEHVECGALPNAGLFAYAVERNLGRIDLRRARLDLRLGGVELAPALHHRGARLIAVDVETEPLLAQRLLGLTDRRIFGTALINRDRQLADERRLGRFDDLERRVASLQNAPRHAQARITRTFTILTASSATSTP